MSDRKLPIGSRVIWRDPGVKPGDFTERKARVVRHGYDVQGMYTEVQAEDGERYKVHRSTIRLEQ